MRKKLYKFLKVHLKYNINSRNINKNNLISLKIFHNSKYKSKLDNRIYDGLDAEDNPNDYEKVYL